MAAHVAADVGGEVFAGLVAEHGVLLQGVVDDLLQLVVDERIVLAHLRGGVVLDFVLYLLHLLLAVGLGGREGKVGGEHLEQDDAQGEDIGILATTAFLKLLGRHVGRGAEAGAGSHIGHTGGDAEVNQLDVLVVGKQHDVVGLDVEVEDAVVDLEMGYLLVVEDRHRFEDLEEEGQCARFGDKSVLAVDVLFQTASLNELHDDVHLVVLVDELNQLGDIGMLGVEIELRLHFAERVADDRIGDMAQFEFLDSNGETAAEVNAPIDFGGSTLSNQVMHLIVWYAGKIGHGVVKRLKGVGFLMGVNEEVKKEVKGGVKMDKWE